MGINKIFFYHFLGIYKKTIFIILYLNLKIIRGRLEAECPLKGPFKKDRITAPLPGKRG